MKSILSAIISITLMMLVNPSVFAQTRVIEWQKSLGGSANDHGYDILPAEDNGYIMFGKTESNDGFVHGNHGKDDIWIVRLNEAGDTLWTKCFGGGGDENASTAWQTYDGNYIFLGASDSIDGDVNGIHGEYDLWVIKMDPAGDTLWTKCLGGSNNEFGFMTIAADNGYIIAGRSNSNDGDVHGNHGNYDCWVVKLNESGDTVWTRSLGGSEFDVAYGLNSTSDNGCIIAGYSYSNDGDVHGIDGPPDCWIVKLDASGDTIWTKSLGGSDWDAPFSIQETFDNGYIFAGYTESDDGDIHGHNGSRDFWIVRLNETGDTLWTRCLGSSNWDEANSVIQTADSGYIVTGEVSADDGDVNGWHGQKDAWFIKLNATGDTLWTKCIGGSGLDWPYSIHEIDNDEYIVAGYSSSTDGDVIENYGMSDFWVFKITQCPKYTVVDTSICSGESYLAGGMLQFDEGTYYDTLQTYFACDSIIITNLTLIICDNIETAVFTNALNIYPIPTNGTLYIQKQNFMYIELYDITGRKILTTNENILDLSGLNEGVYYISVIDKTGIRQIRKVVYRK